VFGDESGFAAFVAPSPAIKRGTLDFGVLSFSEF
jgi:hypothetical protein